MRFGDLVKHQITRFSIVNTATRFALALEDAYLFYIQNHKVEILSPVAWPDLPSPQPVLMCASSLTLIFLI